MPRPWAAALAAAAPAAVAAAPTDWDFAIT
jgi:hypothetical protein